MDTFWVTFESVKGYLSSKRDALNKKLDIFILVGANEIAIGNSKWLCLSALSRKVWSGLIIRHCRGEVGIGGGIEGG
jgi:hypothetical protein